MELRQLAVAGSWEVTGAQLDDNRGLFLEWFKARFVEAVGHSLNLAQANCSVSAAGVLRGIHFAEVPPGQAKYVTCIRGAVLGIVVDIRVGSPTFGSWYAVLLDDTDRRAVYLSEGLGHAFLSLEDGSTVASALCGICTRPRGHQSARPRGGYRLADDARSGEALELVLFEMDTAAPSLAEAEASGRLTRYIDVRDWINGLD